MDGPTNASLAELLALDWMDLGVAAATNAGIAHDRILNLMSGRDLREWAKGEPTSGATSVTN